MLVRRVTMNYHCDMQSMVSASVCSARCRFVHAVNCALSSARISGICRTRASSHLVRAVRSTRRTESRATRLGFAGGGSCVFCLAPSPHSCWCAVERRPPDCLVTVTTSASQFCDRPCRLRRRHDKAVSSLRQPHRVRPLPLNSTEIHVAPQPRSRHLG
jgi:hypothetical protein